MIDYDPVSYFHEFKKVTLVFYVLQSSYKINA